jgi:hypothetical protein
MRDAVRQTITFTAPNGKYYKLRDDGKLATLLVRYALFFKAPKAYFWRSHVRASKKKTSWLAHGREAHDY